MIESISIILRSNVKHACLVISSINTLYIKTSELICSFDLGFSP